MQTPTVQSLILAYTSRLEKAGVDSPKLCAEIILQSALGMDKPQIIVNAKKTLDADELAFCEYMLGRRETGEPMAYILGWKEFYGRDFTVNSNVLVPRPETELLVELALSKLLLSREVLFADLGCGSGCIFATLLLEAKKWRGVGVDISEAALEVCRENIHIHKVAERAELLHADFANNPFDRSDFDLIVSNPPYIPTAEYEILGFEVKNFEPELALKSGKDGLEHPRQVVALAQKILKPGGWLLMEIGAEQGKAAASMFDQKKWKGIEVISDLAGLDRVACARKI